MIHRLLVCSAMQKIEFMSLVIDFANSKLGRLFSRFKLVADPEHQIGGGGGGCWDFFAHTPKIFPKFPISRNWQLFFHIRRENFSFSCSWLRHCTKLSIQTSFWFFYHEKLIRSQKGNIYQDCFSQNNSYMVNKNDVFWIFRRAVSRKQR